MTIRLTMRLGATGKIIALDRAGKATTFGDAGDIDNITILEDICLNDIAEVELASSSAAELA